MITVIGLGPMGQAMARQFLTAGHSVTVWNRTASRAEGLGAHGARIAPTKAEALAANELVILSLTDYQAMYDILDGEELAGRVFVNLSSDTPKRTVAAAKWLSERGATLLAGGIMVPAPLVGSDVAYVFYSGPKDEFVKYESVLKLIGRPDYLGEDHGLAQLYYQAQLDMYLTSLSAYLHASALLKAHGVAASDFLDYATDLFNSVASYLPDAAHNIDNGSHPGDLAAVTMMGATADHIVTASKDAGVDVGLPEAVQSQYHRAIASGNGSASWTSLYEVIKKSTHR